MELHRKYFTLLSKANLLRLYFFLFLFLFLNSKRISAQFDFSIEPAVTSEWLKKISLPAKVANVKQAETESKNLVNRLRTDGYLLASFDSIKVDSLSRKITAFIFGGERFEFASLRKGNVNVFALSDVHFSEKFYSNHVFNPKQVSLLLRKLLKWYEDNGYPFAKVFLDSVVIRGNTIDAVLAIEKNRLVIIDSILIQGDWEISNLFLNRYLGVWPGDYYSEAKIRAISSRLKQLPFVIETKPVMMKLTDRVNKVILFTKKRNASQFDGIIGLLPTAGGKTIFTGDAKIKLQNSVFRSGEVIELNWRRLQSQTQDLKTKLVYPFPFGLPTGIDHSFKLYKKDTTFLDVLNNLGVQYFFSGLNGMKAFYRQRNSSILSTAQFAGITVLPEYADITTRAYGLGLNYEKLDYKLNPRKGMSLNLTLSAGNRTIRKNPKLEEELYANLKLKSSQYQGELEFASFIPVLSKATIKFGMQAAFVKSDQLFRNELFRIGGLKTLRGFDEESLFASSYGISTVEYRFLFEENSAIFLFADACWYERNLAGNFATDLPVGIGAGINFETKAGIFSLNYALGNQNGNGFDVRSGKIHFGIVNAF